MKGLCGHTDVRIALSPTWPYITFCLGLGLILGLVGLGEDWTWRLELLRLQRLGKVGSDKGQCRELINWFHLSTDNFDTFKQAFPCTNWVWGLNCGVCFILFSSHCLFNGKEVRDFSWKIMKACFHYEIMLGGFVLHYIHNMETMKMFHCIVNHNIFWILLFI